MALLVLGLHGNGVLLDLKESQRFRNFLVFLRQLPDRIRKIISFLCMCHITHAEGYSVP